MLAFLISWIISIFCYYNSVGVEDSDPNSVVLFGGSVVLFCISILLEVFDRIETSAPFFKRLLTALIVFSTIGCMSLGLGIIFVDKININPNLLITLCVIPVCLYTFDAITYFLIRPPANSNDRGAENTLRDIRLFNY